MTHVATMGAFSCACIAIAGWKLNHKDMEENYICGPESFKRTGASVEDFYDDVLYPTRQDLGRSGEYPFSLLMEELDEHEMGGKYIVAVLAEFQVEYWEPKLLEHGFELVDKTNNDIGTINHIYTRNNNRVSIET